MSVATPVPFSIELVTAHRGQVTARIELAITRSGTTITATPKVVSLNGKVSNISFFNDIANSLKGYITKHVNASIEKKSSEFSANINQALASAAANGRFSAELKKLLRGGPRQRSTS